MADLTVGRIEFAPTRGPWQVGDGKIREAEGEWFSVGLQGNPWKPIAVLSRSAETTEEDRANARLIAAAPDLLAALKAVRSVVAASAEASHLFDGFEIGGDGLPASRCDIHPTDA